MSFLLTVAILAVLEVSLSFDNAVVNATVLRNMTPTWQRRFITYGMPVAVFGMRLIFPALIVAVAASLPIVDVFKMAIYDSAQYGKHLAASHNTIASFGGMFLLMLFLQFLFDEEKETHWISFIERRTAFLGKMDSIEIAICVLVIFAFPTISTVPAICGLLSYVALKGTLQLCVDEDKLATNVHYGLVAFIYLEVLDASFSFDGVIGAFAISTDIVAIMIGLGLGALAIRSLTLRLVRKGVLEQYTYLEHGAHWSIGALSVIMLLSTQIEIPQLVTGLLSAGIIALSLLSSWSKHEE